MSAAERETPAGEAMREAVAQWLESEVGLYVSDAAEKAGKFCGPSGPIASELARLTAERDAETRRADEVSEERDGLRFSLRCASEAHLDAEAALTTLRADHAAEVARLRAELKPTP